MYVKFITKEDSGSFTVTCSKVHQKAFAPFVLYFVFQVSSPVCFLKNTYIIIMKSLDPLRAKKIFIRKKLGHTAVSAI